MILSSLFEFAVNRHPNEIAIIENNKKYSYKEFDQLTNKLAYSLQKIGIRKGNRIVTLTKNRMEMVAMYWAAQKIGAIFTPINFRLSSEEVRYCVENAEATLVLYERVSEDALMGAMNKKNKPILISVHKDKKADQNFEFFINQENENFIKPNLTDDDVCLMLYTSGTTGKPKGVPRTNKNEYSASTAHIIQNEYITKERTLGIMPLYHTMGMRSLLAMTFLNGTLVMIPEFEPEAVLETIEKEKVSCVYLVPTIIHDVLNHHKFKDYNLSSLKKVGYAGAAMTKKLTEDVYDKLNPEVFVNHYGSTEVYTYTICNYLNEKPGCAGRAGFHQYIRVVTPDPDGNVTPNDIVSQGESGEIIVNTESIEAFQGYWKRPEATKKALREGWYFTGDMGEIDEEGDLYVVGRVDDMIISGGENIHPLEVEDILAKHSDVQEAVVVGVKNERWGEKVVAYVVTKSKDLTSEMLDQYCKSEPGLSNFKRPRQYVFVDEIPKSPVGKILRNKLREQQNQLIFKEGVS
ncbi:class I adenylate-forming enzyme family protein [Salinicoccus sp. HZC-1]|uniref:class I adenylate-forming enzyme family protein n=1 Tax=Salinicoccus sp. HZC-1 TaxID=3385497 RepID=UPI00398B4023